MNAITKPIGVFSEHSVERWDGSATAAATERVAEETPVALVYNGLAYAVMMVSPAEVEDFVLGFTLSEGIVARFGQLRRTEVVPLDEGMLARMEIDAECAALLEAQRRNLAGRTGCGLCGAESIEQAVRHPARVGLGPSVSHAALHNAFEALTRRQTLNAMTGAVHAAAWASPQGELLLVREDVGRHNALDKMIGALVRQGRSVQDGFAIITSRASFEMAQKAAIVGITVLAAISAPTGLAIRVARETGLTLVGFARDGKHNVYAGPNRLQAV